MKTDIKNKHYIQIILTWVIIITTVLSPVVLADNQVENSAITTLEQSKIIDARKNAVAILKHKDSLEAAFALAQSLSHDQAVEVRIAAAGALWGHAYAAQVEKALWQATEDEPQVAVRAAGALKSLGIPANELAPTFRKGLSASGIATRFNAARGLIGIDDSAVLMPHLLNHLQHQSSKNNPSGIKAASDALAKIFKSLDTNLNMVLLQAITLDQAGNHVVLELFEHSTVKTELLEPYIISAANSQFVLNRIAAARLMSNIPSNKHQAMADSINHLFSDDSTAVIEAMARSCGHVTKLTAECEHGLKEMMNSDQAILREMAAEVLSDSNPQVISSDSQGGLVDELALTALNDASDDVRHDAIKAYINADISDSFKANLLVDVALKETQPYIITFALSRLNQFQQYLNKKQKERLVILKSHADAEVKRIANLMF